jgi:hypothetical protein
VSPTATITESQPLILHLGPILQKMSDHEFFAFCQLNPEWRMERTSAGDLVICVGLPSMPNDSGRELSTLVPGSTRSLRALRRVCSRPPTTAQLVSNTLQSSRLRAAAGRRHK